MGHNDLPKASEFNPSKGYKRYVLGVLMLVYAFNFIDRQIITILLPGIKADLLLSDTQLGLLTGFAFAAFYVVMGIPLANLADRWNRVSIMTIATALWSVMTALCGLSQGFIHLLLARIGVGVGEAGCTPPAHSIIADYFVKGERTRALAIYSLGATIGGGVGLMLGGYLSDVLGWRAAFVVVGVPGLVLAVIMKVTVKEPPRGHSDGTVDAHTDGQVIKLHDAVYTLLGNRCLVLMTVGSCFLALAIYGMFTWFPSFLGRSFGGTLADIGYKLGMLNLVAGGAGLLLGGWLGDKLANKDPRWLLWIPVVMIPLSIPFGVAAFFASSSNSSLLLYAVPFVVINVAIAPSYAVLQWLAPPQMRAMAVALYFFFTNLVGIGCGPLLVGFLSDWLTPVWHQESLRYSMLMVFLGVMPAIPYFYWRASRKFPDDETELRLDPRNIVPIES